ncbi:FAST kinase domain-containing protein 2, mitochondrial [Apteryx mantelli]|uniref:FAST kinase domain-containing protein 2 n=1 Tax=Apteryx mantelli TaxID=2696672 RepID=A0A8B7J9P5_9AVES|nr:PREDICTED: FAST kinase domain-containing protein 2 [Apteryx mantelli mantelli]XP_013807777.1 PREDICTED: FAST kinase domain-containing protein 2 [Apteryx mantelli mantelli]XP_025945070.1 FAST kinase domain-containing protein 2, mitochondrial [Apteryx rowi]XP_025945078.1 FAST kinase domain-containing protein 2, mitochondrial [Apteryx rowi]XP_025945082.1 FAST kinase domain-containing protein 2, mitochondrial [Apteryx rowi]
MNNKISYLLKTVRCMHRCNSLLAPSSSTTVRAHTLGTGRYKDPVENANFRKNFLNIFRCLHEPFLRSLSQKTDVFSTGAKIQMEKSTEAWVSEQASQSSLKLQKLEDDSGNVEAKQGADHTEQFFHSLQKCTCPCDVLDLASESAISTKHFTNCLTTVWRLLKNLSEDQQRYEKRLIFEHPAFVQLCRRLLQDSRRMTRGDLVFSLHAVVNVGIPQNTLLVQTLLRVCQEKLNQLDNRCVSVLASTLAGLDKDKNVSALQAGLRLLVEQRIPDIRDIFILQNLMRCLGKDAPVFLKKKLEMAVLKEIDHLTFPNAHRVFLALVAMNYCSVPILNACSEKILENIHDAPFRQLILILEACHNLQYRNVKLFSAVANYVTSTVCLWDKRQIILFLSAFEMLGFQPSELMDIFAEKVTEDPEFLNLKYLLIILRVYSRLNYISRGQKHLFFETLHSCLNKYLPHISNTELLKAVYSLCILGYLPHLALDQLLQKDNLDELLQSGDPYKEQKERMLQCVKACVELDSPSFTKPAFGLAEDFSSLVSLNLRKAHKALLELLGDENMFRQNVQLPHKYHIDFEIRMDSERKKVLPVTATDDHTDTSVERLAFLFVPLSAFCLGTTHPQGKLAMKKRHLNKLGYHVIVVMNKKFQEMTNEDAVEFLKGKIYSRNAFPFSEVNAQNHN